MVMTSARDPAWTAEAMGKLWTHVEESGFASLRWELGLFNMRDLIEGRESDFRDMDYRTVRIEMIWGCPISVVSMWDQIAIVAASKSNAKDAALHRFVVGEAL